MRYIKLCQYNREGGYSRMVKEYEAGWNIQEHCDCENCEYERMKRNLPYCQDRTCDACKRLKSGEKIKDWFEDRMS